jgi:hypothetical protein
VLRDVPAISEGRLSDGEPLFTPAEKLDLCQQILEKPLKIDPHREGEPVDIRLGGAV